jgi:tetratricopeptide (TPR) repeat protein
MRNFTINNFLIIGAAFFLSIPMNLDAVYSRENPSEICKEAMTLASKGETERAIPLFEKSVSLSPRSALAHYGLGRALLYKPDNGKRASKELSIAVDCDHKMAKAYFYLGFSYWFQKKYEYAITAFYQAYTVDKSYKESLYNIGAIYSEMGQESKSTRFFREYVKADSKSAEPF